MKLNHKQILAFIFLLTLAFRLYFAFSQQSYSSDESYFHLRLIDYIKENKLPMFYDEFSYGGQEIFYPQLFHILIAILSLIPFALKIIPALIASSLVIIIYLIAKKITNDTKSSLLTAFLAAFIPIEIHNSVNQISIYSFIIPLILILYLCLMNLEEKKYFNLFLILSFLLPLIHPVSLLFIFSLVFYLILANTESLFISRYKREAIIFSFFIILLINFLIYRNLFLKFGFGIIWQNIPTYLFSIYFKNINLFESIYLIGALPLILGSLGIFFGLFKQKDNSIIVLTAAILATLLLLSLKILNIQIGILFLGIFLVIISSSTISKIYNYITLTKFSKLKKYITYLVIILIIGLSLIPSYFVAKDLPNYNNQVNSFLWVKENTPLTAIVIAPVELGNILTSVAKRKNIIDNNFLLARNTEERLNDVNLIYTTTLEVKALESLNKYGANYIYFDSYVRNKYNLTKLKYFEYEAEKCFEEIKNDVYKVLC